MCMECSPLIKAIDSYIRKADDDLKNALEEEGYAEPEETVEEIQETEDRVAEALFDETDYILMAVMAAVDLESFAKDDWPEVKENDGLKNGITVIFADEFEKLMPRLIEYYLSRTDKELKLEQVSRRTTAWIGEWSQELGEIMQLNSHKEIEGILKTGLKEGIGVEEFTRRIQESGIRNEYYKARRVAVTEVLTAHRAAQQEAFMQSPVVAEKMWKHTGSYRNSPRQNHVDMNGQRVPVSEPFELTGADGRSYSPMFPGDPALPPGERINCHCTCQPVVSEDILGLSLEERQRLQQEAIDGMDNEWEKELDAKNRAKAGITPYSSLENFKGKTREEQIQYLGKSKMSLYDAGLIDSDEMLKKVKKSTLQELREDGIFTVGSSALKHSTVGDFSNLRNPKKPAGSGNGGNMTGGGHSQANLAELEKRGIAYRIEKTYDNGVRIGGVANHGEKTKRLDKAGQSWFPENWDSDRIAAAGTFTANRPAIVVTLKNHAGDTIGYQKFQKYDGITIGIFEDADHNPGTIFPDNIQREVDD